MTSYTVTWTIDVEADDTRHAAELAQSAQRRPDTMATVFEVTNDETGDITEIDLSANAE